MTPTPRRAPRGADRLRVAVVHDVKAGGAQRRLREQLRHLGDRIDAVECILEGGSPVTADPIFVPLRQSDDSVPSWTKPIRRYTGLADLMVGYRRLAGVVEALHPDVVWLNPDHRIQAPWVGVALAQRSFYYCDEPRRIDYDQASSRTTRRRTRIPYWPVRRLERSIDRSTATHVALMGTNSRYTAEAIEAAYGVVPEVVPCGISDVFCPDPVPTPGREPAYLLSVGTLIPAKGHDLVLHAAAQSGLGLPVHVVSHRDEGNERQRLEHLAADLRVPLSIHIDVDDYALRDLYRGAFATLYLAEREPFGLVSVEAQACGSPVIVADEGGLPETVVDGRSGFTVRRGTQEAADRLKLLASDDHLRSRLAACGAQGRAAWSWERSAEGIGDCLAKVAS